MDMRQPANDSNSMAEKLRSAYLARDLESFAPLLAEDVGGATTIIPARVEAARKSLPPSRASWPRESKRI